MSLSIAEYVERLAETHGVDGFATQPDGSVVYAAYRDGDYDLYTADGRLTDADGDVTTPEWLDGRGTILALRDVGGAERHDLVEVDPEDGAVTPVLDDEFDNHEARPSPADPNRIAFLSNRDRSMDLYTLDLEAGDVVKRSESEETIMGYAWSPEGDRLVYQTGLIEGSTLRVVDLDAGTDAVLVDEPDSEQSISYVGGGRGAWSEEGIVFTTNHRTGFREIAVADADGTYELRHANERDKYDPQWTAGGDVVFLESRGGNRTLCRLEDGTVSTIEPRGMNVAVDATDDGIYYHHLSPETAGDLRRNGEAVVTEGRVDLPTVTPEEVTYESEDGHEIAARFYAPDGESKGAVVKPHGGPPAQHFTRLDPVAQALVHAGFEVLAPDFRGSIGYGRGFRKATDGDLGGPDLRDVEAGAAYLRDRGHDRVGITGASYGGYLTLMGVGATDAFDAGASVCGVVNWKTTYENARQYLGDYFVRKFGDAPEENPELYEERSPITYVDDVDVPLLIVQGANDPRVPESEADQLVASLEERDIPHEYVRFEDEGHSVVRTENRAEYVARTVSFFETHLRRDAEATR